MNAAAGPAAGSGSPQVPRSFQFLVAGYIVLTGVLPRLVQALAFGVDGGVEAEFAAAMLTTLALDLLLIVPVFILARHPLGILHPILLSVVVWPLLLRMPSVIEQLGGWGPVILGQPVDVPYFIGLGYQSASQAWTGIAKYNALQIVGVGSIYLGFALWRSRRDFVRAPPRPLSPVGPRAVMLGLIFVSLLTLLIFLYVRGGLTAHLADLGRGRFRSLAGSGVVLVIADFGAIASYFWIAFRPHDAKSPIFITALLLVISIQFISNGSRGSSVSVLMLVGLTWALRVQRIPWRIALLTMPLVFLSLGLMNVIRTSSWSGLTAGEAISDIGAADAIERIEQEVRQRRALSSPVPIVERGFQVAGGPLYGDSYVAAVFAFVPRSIWEDKPRGAGSLYAQMFLGAEREGRAIPVGPTAEAYWNFGIPGVVVLFAVHGVLLKLVYLFFWRRFPDPFAICLYAMFITLFRFSTDDLVRFQQQFALLIIAYAAVRFLVPRPRLAYPDSRIRQPHPLMP